MRSVSGTDHIAADARRLHELMVALGRYRSLRDPIADGAEEIHFTAPQFHTLFWLGIDGPLAMGELAARCGITEKTITGVIDRLEREGYVQRERDQHDRRVIRVRLSRKGAVIHGQLQSRFLQRLSRFLEMIEPVDRSQLLRIIERLVARVESDNPRTEPKRAARP
jgi:DNA-binding MarR family transcriptional regulator